MARQILRGRGRDCAGAVHQRTSRTNVANNEVDGLAESFAQEMDVRGVVVCEWAPAAVEPGERTKSILCTSWYALTRAWARWL